MSKLFLDKKTQKSHPLLPSNKANLLLPKFQILQDITDLADKLKSKQLELAQKQLLLETTKTNLQIQLQQDEIDIKQKVIVVKKRENISALVEKLRQQEVDLQGKIFARISKNKEFQKLQNSQQKIVSDNITNNLLKTDPKRGNKIKPLDS